MFSTNTQAELDLLNERILRQFEQTGLAFLQCLKVTDFPL